MSLRFVQNLLALLFVMFIANNSYGQNALHFDGVDDYVETSFPGVLGGSTPITVEAWIKNYSRGNPQIITDWGANAIGSRFTFRLQDVGGTSNVLRIEISGSGMNGTINVGDSTWHHVAIVYDPNATNNYTLYVDGVLDVQGNLSTSLNIQGASDMRIGQRMASMQPHNFDGAMEEVRVWNVARSLTQIIADTATEFCQPQSGLVAYHRFNSGTPAGTNTNDTISIDDSGLSNDGQLHGFALNGNNSNWVTGKLTACIPPSCLNPSGLGVTNILGTSADVQWTQNNTGSTFKVEYGISGFTLGQGIKLTPSTNTVSLAGLIGQTTYDVYVKEICSATDSSSWSMVSFTTGCTVVNTYPYLESFDSTSTWVSGTSSYNVGAMIDPCWTRTPGYATSTYSWGTRTGSTFTGNSGPTTDFSGSGNYVYTEASFGSTGAKADFKSPNYDLSPLTVPQLTFQSHMYGINIGTLSVWVWNGSSYDTVWTLSGDQGNMWNEVVVDLSPYANTTTHLVFHAERGPGFSGDIAIDNVQIEETPLCPKPLQVSLDSITSSTVNINFVSGGTKFEVEYGPTGFNQASSTSTVFVTGSGQTITGLNPNTGYDFYIKNDCTDSSKGMSTWTGPYTIHTLCAYTNSYFTNWDQLANNQPDLCWSFLQFGSTSGYARAFIPSATHGLQPFSGTQYYTFNNSTATKAYLTSPEISDLPLNTLQIRFQASDTYAGSIGSPALYVGTMVSPSDTGSFVAVDTVVTTSNTWNEFTVLLDNVPANHKFITLRHAINSSVVIMAIDDLYIEAIPACIPPSGAVASQIKDTSMVIDWEGGDASTWDIEYGIAGFTQGMGTIVNGLIDTNTTITGLSAQTCYDFYIRGNCTATVSPWYGPFSSCTDCAIRTAPYTENFDDTTWVPGFTTANQINICWSRTPAGSSTYRWETEDNATGSGSTGPTLDASGTGQYVYTESSSGSTGTLSTLETPMVDFSSLTQPALSFAYHMYGATIGELYVLIFDGTQNDTLHLISGQQQSSSSDAWKTAYVDLTAYKSLPRKIQFVGKRGTSYTGDIAIDEVVIDEMPTCIAPTNFALDSVNATFADFSWTSTSNGTSFKMEYGPVGFNQASGTGTKAYSSLSPTRVSGLTANTSYDIYLTDLCDSTQWVGPITFTTLIADDAELLNLVSPSNLDCGDSSYVVEVMVKNNGLNPITSMGVGANISGAITTFISNSFTGTIAPGASTTITVGTINTYAGGSINIEAFTALAGDQVSTNDTLEASAIEIVSVIPAVLPIDTLCANDTSGQFIAVSQTGIVNNWYQNAADVTPFTTGDTVSVSANQTLFLDRSKEVDQLILDAPHTSSQFGNMFKIYIKEDFTFTGFSFVPATSGNAEPIAFYKQGNFVGHETTPGDWTAIDSLVIPGASANNWYRINFTNPVQFTQGDTISFYLANKLGTKMRWQNLTSLNAVGDMFLSNSDFEYYAGVTGAYFGSNMTSGGPRAVSSVMHYSSNDVCGNNRISLTMGVNNDTAVASFTSTVNANGADVDFDGSASTGHVYAWDFGDGQTGTGVNATNTYTTAGTYTVTLVVTDTVCGTTDTIAETVLANVSLTELSLNGSVEVYPNPNKGEFNIDLHLVGGHDVQLVLANTVGQVVYTKDLGRVGGHVKTELNIGNLAPGVYYLRVLANGKTKTVKITVL